MATSNSNKSQQDQQGQQPGILNSNNLWNSDVARANQLGGNASAANFGLGASNFGLGADAGSLGRSNVMDALMIARLQQSQDQQQQQHDALRRLSIDTIGSSHRSAGLEGGANGLGRLNPNNLLQLQQQQNLLGNNNQFLNSQQRELQSQLQQAGIGGGGNAMGGGLYPRSDSLSFMQNFDPSSATVANLRLQQGLVGMVGGSGMNNATGSNLSQSLLAHNLLPGNQLDFSNSGLEVDYLYRALLQQQQKQQSDSMLNLHLNQQQLMSSFGNDPAARSDIPGGSRLEPGVTGLDSVAISAQQNRIQGQSANIQQSGRTLGSDQLDWSRNSESNIDSNTLLSLQQQQQLLQQQQQQQLFQQQQQQLSDLSHINYQGVPNNQMMNFEEQLAMNSSMWNYPSSMLNLQQQNQLFSQQFQGGNLEGDLGAGGIGSSSLLSALFSESAQQPFDLTLPINAAANLGSLNHNMNRDTATSAAAKPVKAPVESAAQLPVRALSAYNFFFRDERERIINCDEGDNPLDPLSLKAKRDAVVFNDEKKNQLLSGHWFRDRTAKRRHRKTHGKIAFTALSKVIAQAWRDLPDNEKAFYREVAADDLERYQRELEQYKVVDGTEAGMPKATPTLIIKHEPLDDSEK